MKDIFYKLKKTEIDKLLKNNFMILYDTREKEKKNQHVLDYFDKKKIKYRKELIEEGDYTAIITKAPEYGINRDVYFKIGVERKNSVEELAGNLAEKTDTHDDIRLERELIRAAKKGIDMYMLIEDPEGLYKIRNGLYNSSYGKNAFNGKFFSINAKYTKGTTFCGNMASGEVIYKILYYGIRAKLYEGLGGEIDD